MSEEIEIKTCHFCEHAKDTEHPRISFCGKKEKTVAFYAARECKEYKEYKEYKEEKK